MNFWLVQANNKDGEGWHWNRLLKNNLRNEKPTGGPFQFGGEWIRNARSRKRIRKEFRSGDIAFCYQADPGKPTLQGKQFVGLARIDMQGAEDGSSFYLDWWCRMPPVSYAQIKKDDLLGKSEKVTGVGQGTVFTLSKSEAERLLALSNPNQELLQRIRTHLKIALETAPDSVNGRLRSSEELGEDVAAELIETARDAEQGFQNDPEIRKALEQHAARRARRHYEKMGYTVLEQGKPFDLECTCLSGRLDVEVKGTQTAGSVVILTPNEVEWAHTHEMELFVVHSLVVSKVSGCVIVSGGVERIVKPWRPRHEALKAIGYSAQLPPVPCSGNETKKRYAT